MYGKFQHTIDNKGRLFIPSRLREKFGKGFFVTISWETCLTIYSIERWESAEEKLRSMSQTAQMEMRSIFSNAVYLEPDAQGRVVLPQNLREHVGLKKEVTIIGTGLYVQIWDTDKYKQIEEVEMDRDNLKNVIDKYGF